MSPMKITLSSGTVVTIAFTINIYPVFDNVNKVLTIFGEASHVTTHAVFTNVAQVTSAEFTVS